MIEIFIGRDRIGVMKKKPLIFTLLTILCLIEPLIKILYFKASTHFDLTVVLANISARQSFRDVFDFWIVFPLAGVSLLKIREWSYYAFLSLLSYIVYTMMTYERYTWPYNSDAPFAYHYLIVGFSFLVFLYFLVPAVRRPFFDQRVRWWEPKERYRVSISCKVMGNKLIFPSEILNISQSGAFLKDSGFFKLGEKFNLEFEYLGSSLSLPVTVVNEHQIQGQNGFGVEFNFKNLRQNIQVAKFIKSIKNSHSVG